MLPIPKDYKIVYVDKNFSQFNGVFGWCYWDERKTIEIYNLTFLPKFLNKIIQYFVLKHELGHAYGIKSCNKIYCIMFEGSDDGLIKPDTIYEKISLPFQILYGMRYCKECKIKIFKK